MDDINIIRYEVELKDGYYVFTPIIELNGVKMLASIKAFIIANT